MKRTVTKFVFAGLVGGAVAFAGASPAQAAINMKNLAGMWLFDEGKGATATDSSPNGNDGTLLGAAEYAKGVFGTAVELDGAVSSYIEIPSSESLGMEDAVTVMFWVNTGKVMVDMFGDRQVVVGKHYTEYEVGIYTAGQLHTYTSDLAGNYDEGILTSMAGKVGDGDWTKGEWFHVAWTLEGQHEIVYVNGVLLGEYNKPHAGTLPGPNTLEFGRRTGGALPLTGMIDEVAIFNVALEEDDIVTAMDRGLGVATGITPVDPAGKAATTWGAMKSR